VKYWLLLLLLLLSACARPDRTSIPLPSADELLHRLSQGADAYHSLDGEAKVTLTVNGKFFSSQQFLLLGKPDRFRTDVLSTFGQLILQLAVDHDGLKVFLNTIVPGTFYQGTASDENLTRFTRLPVRFMDMMRLLLYDPPLTTYQELQVSLHENGAKLEIYGEQGRQQVIFDRQLRPIESRYFQEDALQLSVTYEKFSERDGFPLKIRIEIPQKKASATIRFSQVRSNIQIPDERFVLKQPANALLEQLPY